MRFDASIVQQGVSQMSNFALRSLLESRALHVRPVNGVVGFGSNSSTSKQTMAAMKAADAQRAELIGMIDLRSVGSRNGRQAIDL
ncbi:MAG: hypothetical protein WA697_16720 [Pseudolabrys sp.]